MTARFLALYETPADPETFDRHYREVHIPLGSRLPGLRRYAVGRDAAAVRGEPYYLVASWNGTRSKTCAPRSPRPRAAPPPPTRRASPSSLRYAA
jgi:uncharacterized protein (TIGR02118 family)